MFTETLRRRPTRGAPLEESAPRRVVVARRGRPHLLGKDVDMPHVSNSYFSARALVNYPERRKQLPPTDHYKQRFLDANCADLSFYYTLVNKLRADKMCKGCSPPPPVWKSTRRRWRA